MPTIELSSSAHLFFSVLGRAFRMVLVVGGSGWLLLAPPAFLVERLFGGAPHKDRPALVTLGVALGGYAVFWLFFLNRWLGMGASGLWAVAALSGSPALFRARRVYAPLALAVGVALLSLGLQNLREPLEGSFTLSFQLPGWALLGDPHLPDDLAHHLLHGEDPRDAGSTWRSSDRPPLQAGLSLLLRPLGSVLGAERFETYHLMAVLFQSLWAVAALFFLDAVGVAGPARRLSFLFCLFSFFFFVNTLFVWPKFLSASLALFGVVFLFYREPTRLNTIVGAAFTTLGALAHGGVLFSLALLVPAWIVRVVRAHHRRLVPQFFGAAFLLYLPWTLYQRFYDPPGNRLLKMHFAGVEAVDSRTVWQALRNAYATQTWSQILHTRWANAVSFPFQSEIPRLEFSFPSLIRGDRVDSFFYFGPMIGILWLGALAIGVQAIHKRSTGVADGIRWLAFLTLSYFFWTLSIFNANWSSLHQGSYLLPLLATLIFSAAFARTFGRLATTLALGHRLLWFLAAVLIWPSLWSPLSLPFVLVALTGAGIISSKIYDPVISG
ncbi:MAG: hypothetical protein HYR96_01900 [Deltaproteobacteria bacterium]|nr:hypothetical protein [Deltaproteobacteria bacterium]